MNVEILSIGNELVRGFTVDRNSAFLSRTLESIGYHAVLHHTVGDDRDRATRLIVRALERCDLVVMTGGLGPTGDDVTREMVCDAAGVGLDFDAEQWRHVRSYLEARGVREEEGHRNQAMIPSGARVLRNRVGSAPGFLLRTERSRLAALPGVPSEMKPMVVEELLPALIDDDSVGHGDVKQAARVSTRVLRLFGLPESEVGELVRPWMTDDADPHVGITASGGTLSLYVTARSGAVEARERAVSEIVERVRAAFGRAIFGEGVDGLADVLGSELIRRGRTIAVAESCTGGLVAQMLTGVPGISEVFLEGAVTYSNAAKTRTLEVPAEMIEHHGAVSEPVARSMAEGIARRAGRQSH